jgi:hypothetical protein
MERSQLVNAANEDPNAPGLTQSVDARNEERGLAWPPGALRVWVAPSSFTLQSPCLYIGPVGQRCNRPARASGFCSRHWLNESDVDRVSDWTIAKRAVAVLSVVVALWPLLADLVRELLRLLR